MKRGIVISILISFYSIVLTAQWVQVWSDEFNYTGSIDKSKWVFEHGADWPNGELQYYTNNRTENCRVNGSHLIIEAKAESYGGKNFTSARINSKESWTYGKYETKARLTKGNALWPAFWLLPDDILTGAPWPFCGEIDIMEYWSWAPYTVCGTIHTDAYNHIDHTEKQGTVDITHPGENFHTYSVVWGPERIDWFVDDDWFFGFANENTTETWPFDKPFHALLNLAVEGWLNEDPANINTWTKTTMEVDYVRVYQWNAQPTVPVGKTVWIKGSNNKYLSSENGTSGIICDRDAVGGWEQFTIVDAGNGLVAIRGTNNKYVSSENGLSDMYCNRDNIGGWETFEWVDLGNNEFALKGSNNNYVTSNNGTAPLVCDRVSIQGWEKFTFGLVSAKSATLNSEDTQIQIKAYPNPAKDNFVIKGANGQGVELKIYNLSAKMVYNTVIQSNKQTINIQELKNGIYVLKMWSNGTVYSEKLIINK